MRQIESLVDERLGGFCVYCGGTPNTRDHVPPKALLDEPYPENLPVVSSCRSCNEGASLDEEYVSCLLEIVACRSALLEDLERLRIATKLKDKPFLAKRLVDDIDTAGGALTVTVKSPRVNRVIGKIARGLWGYETGEVTDGALVDIRLAPVAWLDSVGYKTFHALAPVDLLPEVGSRMMTRVMSGVTNVVGNSWEYVQEDRFSYAVEGPSGAQVKMIVRGVLVAEVDICV